jgi:hypothetical protein
MLERTSKFILEVLPFLLSAAIAAVVVPGLLHSSARGADAVVTSTASALESIGRDNATFSSDPVFVETLVDTAGQIGPSVR